MISWSYLLHIELADYRTYRFNYYYVLYKWTAWICLVDQALLTNTKIRRIKWIKWKGRKEKRSFIMALSVYLMMWHKPCTNPYLNYILDLKFEKWEKIIHIPLPFLQIGPLLHKFTLTFLPAYMRTHLHYSPIGCAMLISCPVDNRP